MPSNTEVNPKEQCNAIVLRGGKKLKDRRVSEPAVPLKKEKLVVEQNGLEVEAKKPSTVLFFPPSVPYPQRLKPGKLDK